ncbi:MAG: hypothetical protein NZL85_04890 [Fimbriimonadales bacterium]|nr:hypothetical protein [Fimbriimonadales bacterium]
MRTLMAGLMSLMAAGLLAQSGWHPLNGWELIERLDNVQVIKVFRPDNLFQPVIPRWQPSDRGDFFPADQLLYYRWATSGQYYAYDSEGKIALDDVQIYPYLDPSGQGRFRISRVEIMVYFPRVGYYTIQGFWTGADNDFPPYPTFAPPATFLRSNQGPHTLLVPQAGVWRLGTNADPNNEVFTVQAGQLGQDFGNMFVFYLGIRVSSPAAWVCGSLPGDPNFDYFIQYEPDNQEDVYQYYGLEGGVQATFGLRVWGAPAPATTLQGVITIEGYTGSYAGRQATIRIRQGSTTNTYTATLSASGSYQVQVREQGAAEVLVQMRPGLARKVNLTLSGTTTQNFTLINGDANGDNVVDDADLLMVLFAFGQTGPNRAEDVNGDNVVDDADLLIVLFNFGQTGDRF